MLIKRYVKNILLVLVIVFIILNPYLIIQSVKNGMFICYENIIPSLFVFMAVANYAAQYDILKILSFPLKWFSALMKVEDSSYSGYILLSLIGGFAVGAKFIKTLENQGYSQKAINVLGIAMINNSLGFCVFTLGAGMLKNAAIGIMLYVACTASCLITAFVFSFIYNYNTVSPHNINDKIHISITEAINNAVSSILSICGFVIIFNTICEVIALYTYNFNDFNTFLCRIMELTSGCIKIMSISGNKHYILCVALSILPVSTLCQVYHFTESKTLIKTLVLSRIIHTPVSLLIFSVLINLFPASLITSAFDQSVIRYYSYNAELSFVLFTIAFIFLKICEENKIFTKTAE